MPHYFTLEDAGTTLEIIRPLMDEIQAIRQDILDHQPEVWPMIEKSAGNGGNRAASELVESFKRLDELVHQILDTGAVLRDLNAGLVDFSAWHADHEVCFCWKFGEERIGFWHEVDAGFAGRKPIDTF
jgi:hypothetical protein